MPDVSRSASCVCPTCVGMEGRIMIALLKEEKTRPLWQVEGVSASLAPGPVWGSWEKFRVQGQDGLAHVGPGTFGTLMTRNGQYRILPEADFQRLLGLARDVERIQSGLRVVVAAARAVQRHPDESTTDTLIEAVALLGDVPILPTRSRFEALEPEGLAADDEDEVELDPAVVRRPYAGPAASGAQ